MVNEKIERAGISFLIFWTTFGVTFYVFDPTPEVRRLALLLTLFFISVYVSKDIKSRIIKYVWVFLMLLNVTEQIGIIFSNDWFVYSALPIFALSHFMTYIIKKKKQILTFIRTFAFKTKG